MAEESLHALQPSELSWNENLMEVATMISLMDFAYLKEQGLGEDNPKWEWIIENKLSFPRRQQFSTGTVLFPVVGWERCIEGTVGLVPLGDICQCLQTSAVFTCLLSTALTALVELVDFSYIQVTQPFSLPNRYRGVRNWYNSWFSWSAGEIIPVETRKSHF